ncbi:patatin-like phospholipase family protein [Actinomadura rugatobispora]|uniref:Patatin-like phospholipase family protein n=1 Tax=Actinomadura rugatobispora TaxID=1994 RepID=A0ABW1A9K6_9ACTN|nr:patatin-like phospholipase family protein [Actinomadura rugatobispora]
MTSTTDRALVLGPGGLPGTAWLLGLAAGLRREGVDLAAADLIVGTSAGAIAGAVLATGGDPSRHAVLPDAPSDDAPGGRGGGAADVFAVLQDPALEPAEALRRAGRMAQAAATVPGEVHVARMEALLGTTDWPERRLLVPAVDVEEGALRVWDRDSGVPLHAAVASSCAMPGVYPPIAIGGRRYMDGALAGGSHAGLAGNADALVLVEPLAHLFPLPSASPVGTAVARIVPDAASVRAFGGDLGDRGAWGPAYLAGARQAPDAAARIRPLW